MFNSSALALAATPASVAGVTAGVAADAITPAGLAFIVAAHAVGVTEVILVLDNTKVWCFGIGKNEVELRKHV